MTQSNSDHKDDAEAGRGKQDDFDPDTPPVPLDGGWGWVVVVASLLCNIIVDGVCFSFGVLYLELLEAFEESKGKTAWVGSLVPGMYLGMGECSLAFCLFFVVLGQYEIDTGISAVFFSGSRPIWNICIVTLS